MSKNGIGQNYYELNYKRKVVIEGRFWLKTSLLMGGLSLSSNTDR
jgi:hypothetical protein